MFNTYRGGTSTSSVKINAVTGLILKNHPKSWFEKFDLNSDRAKRLFKEGGDKGYQFCEGYGGRGYSIDNPENAIVVLQMMLCGEQTVVAELVFKKDFESREMEGGDE